MEGRRRKVLLSPARARRNMPSSSRAPASQAQAGAWPAAVHSQLALAADRESWVADWAAARLGPAAQAAVAAARDAHPFELSIDVPGEPDGGDAHERLHDLVSRF